MKKFRPWLGRLFIVVGLVGTLSAIVCIVTVWRTAHAFSTKAVAIADKVVEIEDKADTRVGQTESALANLQTSVNALKRSTERAADESRQDREVTPEMQQLDERVQLGLDETRRLLQSVQEGANRLSQAVTMFESISSPIKVFGKSRATSENNDLSDLSQSLADASAQIQLVIDFVAKMQEEGLTDEQALELDRAVGRLEQHLDRGRNQLGSIREFLQTSRESVAQTRDELPWRTNLTATALTILLVCFAFTQLHLMTFGSSKLSTGSETLDRS